MCAPLVQHGTLDAMAEHHHMVHMHKLKLLANFVVKGSEEKCGSTSSMTRFPMSAVSEHGMQATSWRQQQCSCFVTDLCWFDCR